MCPSFFPSFPSFPFFPILPFLPFLLFFPSLPPSHSPPCVSGRKVTDDPIPWQEDSLLAQQWLKDSGSQCDWDCTPSEPLNLFQAVPWTGHAEGPSHLLHCFNSMESLSKKSCVLLSSNRSLCGVLPCLPSIGARHRLTATQKVNSDILSGAPDFFKTQLLLKKPLFLFNLLHNLCSLLTWSLIL